MPYISLEQLTTEGNDISRKELRAIDKRLKALVGTVEGTLPGSRGFGINPDIFDGKHDEALNLLVMDLDEKTEKYIPEISIAGIDGYPNPDGTIRTKIYVERRG